MVSGGLVADLGRPCDVPGCEYRAIIATAAGHRVCGIPHIRRLEASNG